MKNTISDKKCLRFMMLPVYNQFTNTWIIETEDGSLKKISNEHYYQWFKKFKTRYDVDDK